MWSDNESTIDLLGFRVHADFIYGIVTDKKMLPVTIGLFGDWGSGKTSVMKMLEEKLTALEEHFDIRGVDNNIVCLYFNGWQFEGYDDAKSAILSSILMQLAENKKIGEKIKGKVASLLKSVNWMRLIGMSVKNVALPAILAYLSGGASLIPTFSGLGKKFLGIGKDKSDTDNKGADVEKLDWEEIIQADKTDSGPLDVRTFRERFAEMLKETKIDSLVVLIDDLDRCSPDRIIDNLEAIKLFLNVENTAFVIGADPRIVRYAVERRYVFNQEPEKDRANRLVQDYLEKLIQIPYHLPRLSPSEIESYMNLLFCNKELGSKEFNEVHSSFQALREKDMYSIFGYHRISDAIGTKSITKSLNEDLSMCSNIAPLITDGLNGNPRQVKRFLNAFILRKKLAKVAKLKTIKDDVLAKLMVLEYVENDCFQELYKWQSFQDGITNEIRLLESEGKTKGVEEQKGKKSFDFSNWQSQFVQKWLRLKPQLAKVDLRDYFWIVRDKMASTLSGTTMVSPFILSIFENLKSETSFKVNSALGEIGKLEKTDIAQLFELLKEFTLRNQKKQCGYFAFHELIGNGIPGSLERYASVLNACKPNAIPASLSFKLKTLFQKSPEVKSTLTPVILEIIEKDDSLPFAKGAKKIIK